MLPVHSAAAIIKAAARSIGAVAVGFARAGEVAPAFAKRYDDWIADGCNGTMDYLARYRQVRYDPRLLLPGASTVISLAFPYRPAGGYHHPLIADYALGLDYHHVLKARAEAIVALLRSHYGAQSRVCVDTAPLAERYWAVCAGVGFVGLNHQLIVPGVGSGVFLCEIVTTLQLPPDAPLRADCGRCGLCIKACPGGALMPDGTLDVRKCLSYLTIEHRGAWTAPRQTTTAYGCDVCQRVCPHNSGEPPEPLAEFIPDPRLLKLDAAALEALTKADWRRLSKATARTRLRYDDFRRNLDALIQPKDRL